jgi:hypothetical protein
MSLKHLFFSLPLLFACLATNAAALPDEWKPVQPEQLSLKTAVVEKDADAEALFWEVRIDDSAEGDLIFNHYLRIKIFTERGRESQSKIDIPYGKFFGREIKVSDISARTIKADGAIVELKKEDIFERSIIKASGAKIKAKSFAMPGIEPGAIIEYRWKEVRVNQSAFYVRLEFQRNIPVQQVKYLIKPFPFEGHSFRSITLHGQTTPFSKEKNGFYFTTMTNVPALHEESRMPPENQTKTWMLVYYARGGEDLDPDKYWRNHGKERYGEMKSLMKVNEEVKRVATETIADAQTDADKIEKLYTFCRTKIRNVSDDASGLSLDELKKLKDNKTPADTLKRGVGNAADIDLLFAALATAAGFDARVVLAPDRGDLFFDKSVANSYFLMPSNIAIRLGDSWKFYNPGLNYVPLGMLRWQEEGQQSLITDPKEPIWVNTPLSPPARSRVKRVGKFKLSEDGTLEGDMQVEFSGHLGMERKERNDGYSAAEREETLKEELLARMSTATLTDMKIENVNDPVKPFSYSVHVKVPGYAQRTGKRLFLQPAVFQRGVAPLFSASERRYPVYFNYPWSENDEVWLELPTGFALDSPDAASPFSGGPISEYKPSLSVSKDGKQLVYKREFFFGGGDNILFPVSSYQQLKAFFDQLHKQDNHTVTLKQATAGQ